MFPKLWDVERFLLGLNNNIPLEKQPPQIFFFKNILLIDMCGNYYERICKKLSAICLPTRVISIM